MKPLLIPVSDQSTASTPCERVAEIEATLPFAILGSAALSPPAPYLTSGPTFVTLRRWKRTLFGLRLPANAPEGQKRFPISRLRS